MYKTLKLPLLLAPLLILTACSCEDTEIQRVKSPDGKVEAVHVRGNCGATTAYSEQIYIVTTGGKLPAEKEFSKFVADHADGLEMAWREQKVLEVRYNKARIFKFSNFWGSNDVENFEYVVEIRLAPLSNHSLPE